MAQASRGEGIDSEYLASTGLAQEAAEKTGMNPQDTERVLQEVLSTFGGAQ
jgi:hypothetical protein